MIGFFRLVFLLSFSFSVTAQVSQIAKKFYLADTLLPGENQWREFLAQYRTPANQLVFVNADSTKGYFIIYDRDTNSQRWFVESFLQAKGSHILKQQPDVVDSVAFIALPRYFMVYNERPYLWVPPFSTAYFKAPNEAKALEYFALYDLTNQQFFRDETSFWNSSYFNAKATAFDMLLEGKPQIIDGHYTRLLTILWGSAVTIHNELILKLREKDSDTYNSIDKITDGSLSVSDEDLKKMMLPVRYSDKQGNSYVTYMYVESTIHEDKVYLWKNRTPVPGSDKLYEVHMKFISSFPSSGWKTTDPSYRRHLIFNPVFWNEEVTAKNPDGSFKYLEFIFERKK